MKVAFINKPFFIEPLGIMYLMGSLKKAGHEVRLILTTDNIEGKVKEFAPDLVCYSIMIGDQGFYDDINRRVQSVRKVLSVAGGPHPTFFPEMIDDSETSFDAVCIGEGE